MYQVTIKIITTKGKDDENPTVYWISPDSKLKDFVELFSFPVEDADRQI